MGIFLYKLFNGLGIKEIIRDEVRNAMENFDERLDKFSLSVWKKLNKKSQTIAYNIVISHKNAFDTFPNNIRIHISSERKFYLFVLTMDIDRIHDEASKSLKF